MSRAPHVPVFPPDGAPVSFLVDYDGTISRVDVGDELLERYFPDTALLAAKDAEYDAGRIGSRALMQWDMAVLPDDEELLRTTAASLPQDETFSAFVASVRTAGAELEIVSDGLGFYVESNLARLGRELAALPVATNENPVAGPDSMAFPYGHPRCFVCGTCKRERVRAHQAGGRVVVFIGDGTSDRYATHHADIVFAKGSLARWCHEVGHPFHAWDGFSEVEAWLRAAFSNGELPRSQADLERWHATYGRPPRDFICGPEAWGEGRTVPHPIDTSAPGT